jgi:hypothetical protein
MVTVALAIGAWLPSFTSTSSLPTGTGVGVAVAVGVGSMVTVGITVGSTVGVGVTEAFTMGGKSMYPPCHRPTPAMPVASTKSPANIAASGAGLGNLLGSGMIFHLFRKKYAHIYIFPDRRKVY